MSSIKPLSWVLFVAYFCLLLSCVPKSRYEGVAYELSSLEEKYSDLEDEHHSLEKKYNTLLDEYNDLVERYNTLVEKRNQFGSKVMNHRYGYDEYHYSFVVRSGRVSWNYRDPHGETMSGGFGCNNDVSGETIMSDCAGVVYWYFASRWLWAVESAGEKDYSVIHLKWAMEALESSYKSFCEHPDCSQDAKNRVFSVYTDLKNAEAAGGSVLWNKISRLTFEMGEYPLGVENLYNYDF
ncbi:MAG: hypothetical protein J5521_05680 [Lachnospiraceae bacterium]|nr:hypothetical protein [Lachnospiraceae bacterium]